MVGPSCLSAQRSRQHWCREPAAKYSAQEMAHPLDSLRESRLGLGENLVERLGSPAKRMRDLIPLGDELGQALGQLVQPGEVGVAQPLALEDAKPLFDRVHPRAVYRREVRDEAGMRPH